MALSRKTKAKAEAMLLLGETVSNVARSVKVDKATVCRWKQAIPDDKLQQIATVRHDDFNRLLVEFLTQLLITATAQAKVAGDPEYLYRQDAEGIAALHSVMVDRLIVFLSAFQAANERSHPESEG